MHVFAGNSGKLWRSYINYCSAENQFNLPRDKIIVLEDGEMIGYGTHKNLMESCEVYREISQSQMGGGIDEA